MRFKFDIGDLVIFQKPNMSYSEWKKVDDYPYLVGMVSWREKAGGFGKSKLAYSSDSDDSSSSYYHVMLPDGKMYYLQREDRLARLAKANP